MSGTASLLSYHLKMYYSYAIICQACMLVVFHKGAKIPLNELGQSRFHELGR